jgi:GntR family transcriptional regulator, transcriptional repressor for pyruvate dehydrogenase complex
MAIERLVETTKPRFVVERILSSLADGSLSSGDRLPSESKLAALAGVGRTSVREALTALRLMGVVETRVGAGSYVSTAPEGRGSPSEIAHAVSLSEEAVQLQEARAVFETGMVRLAAIHWTPEMAPRFTDLLERMSSAADDVRYDEYIALHRGFHLCLAETTRNAVVVRTEQSFLASMDHAGWKDMERQAYLPNRRAYLSRSVVEHQAIFDAVRAGDGAQASELVHNHYARHEAVEPSDEGGA